MRKIAVALAATAIGLSPAAAQNFTLQPTFGSVSLSAGFSPDPHSVGIIAGGPIDAFNALGGNCGGSIADAPDFRLDYGAGGLPLIISVLSSDDTTLVINDPSGNWICDDDSGGSLNPEITFSGPASGTYDIWVGTFNGGTASATLNISELNGGGGNAPPAQPPAGGGGGAPPAGGGFPDVGMQPTFGSVTLSAGFVPDPHTVAIIAGGPIDAFDALGGSCFGDIAEAPDFRLNYTGAAGFQLIISAFSSADTTLVINDPSGNWFCVDDANGLDPEVVFDLPSASGVYDIWVGVLGGGTADATLEISEFVQTVQAPVPPAPPAGGGKPGGVTPGGGGTPPGGGGKGPAVPAPAPPVQGNMPNLSLQPAFGSVTLTTGFMPDPSAVSILAGGPIDAFDALGGSCFGNIAEAPDFRISFTAGTLPLIISTLSATDTTLVVNDPNGNWVCDDDSAGNLNAAVRFNNPMSGQYDVWVGTFGGGTADATLNISEKGP